jgi:hypothetical protein
MVIIAVALGAVRTAFDQMEMLRFLINLDQPF